MNMNKEDQNKLSGLLFCFFITLLVIKFIPFSYSDLEFHRAKTLGYKTVEESLTFPHDLPSSWTVNYTYYHDYSDTFHRLSRTVINVFNLDYFDYASIFIFFITPVVVFYVSGWHLDSLLYFYSSPVLWIVYSFGTIVQLFITVLAVLYLKENRIPLKSLYLALMAISHYAGLVFVFALVCSELLSNVKLDKKLSVLWFILSIVVFTAYSPFYMMWILFSIFVKTRKGFKAEKTMIFFISFLFFGQIFMFDEFKNRLYMPLIMFFSVMAGKLENWQKMWCMVYFIIMFLFCYKYAGIP